VTVGNWAYIKHSQKQIPSQLLLYSAAAWLVCCWLFILQHGHAGWFFFMGFWWMWCSVWFFFFFFIFFFLCVRIAGRFYFVAECRAEDKWNPWYLLSGGGEAVYSFWKTVSHFFFRGGDWLVGFKDEKQRGSRVRSMFSYLAGLQVLQWFAVNYFFSSCCTFLHDFLIHCSTCNLF